MAHVSIKLRDGVLAVGAKPRLTAGRFYQVLIDGREIEDVTMVQITWVPDDVPRAHISLLIKDLEIDDEALAELTLCAKRKAGTV
jgi:hypothetical protein